MTFNALFGVCVCIFLVGYLICKCSKTLLMCSQLQKDSTKVLTEYESDVEKNCIGKIQAFISEDLPAINRARKHLNKTNIELTTLRAKYDSSQKAIQSSNQLNTHQAETKLESLRKDLEDIQHKLDQCRVWLKVTFCCVI